MKSTATKTLAALIAGTFARTAHAHAAAPIMNLFGSSNMAELEKSIVEMAKLSPSDFQPLAESVQALISETIEPDLKKQLASSQSAMNSLSQGFQHCDDSYPAPNLIPSKTAHEKCRESEAKLYNQWADACLTTVPQFAKIYFENCIVNLRPISNIQMWPAEVPSKCAFDLTLNNSAAEQKFEDLMNYFQDKLDTWTQANNLCQGARAQSLAANATCQTVTDAYYNQSAKCTQAQASMDATFCQASIDSTKYCPLKQQCYAMAQAAVVQHNNTIAAEEAGLKAEWQALQSIKCLLNNALNSQQEDCTITGFSSSPMNIKYLYFENKKPFMPDMAKCTAPYVPRPGSDSYVTAFYGNLPTSGASIPVLSY